MTIKIIGAGFPRTGTTTLKWALETLGYGKCYHMKELLNNPCDVKYWLEIELTGRTNWDELFADYQACVDVPSYPYYKILMKKYPDAKVILTKMPFDNWYEDAKQTIAQAGPQTINEKILALFKLIFNARLRQIVKVNSFFKEIFWKDQFNHNFCDKLAAKKIYDDHIETVISYVPADKLLVYEVSQGWTPLCNFLDKPIPNESFKHLNRSKDFKTMLKDLIKG